MNAPRKLEAPSRPRTEELLNALQQKLAGIFFKRGLLPLVTFGERSLSIPKAPDREGSHVRTYDEFIRGENSQVDGPIFQAKIMERGIDSQTDRVLDLLVGSSSHRGSEYTDNPTTGQEGSIFEVLVRRRLQAMKFTVVKKTELAIEIFEAYTLSFAYHSEHSKQNSGNHDVANTNPGSNTGKVEKTNALTTVRSAVDIVKGIRQMDRLLIPLTSIFTKLPDARALGVFLLYTDDCPEGYQAPDFVDAGDFVFKFANEEDQTVRKLSCGGISTGHHSVYLKVTYLNPVSTSCRTSEAHLSPRSVRVTREETEAIPIPPRSS
ncbi:unnamed protein product [Penicillium pancosmium]